MKLTATVLQTRKCCEMQLQYTFGNQYLQRQQIDEHNTTGLKHRTSEIQQVRNKIFAGINK